MPGGRVWLEGRELVEMLGGEPGELELEISIGEIPALTWRDLSASVCAEGS